ncbi:Uncharacterised protein [Segatella copri]|nr:Uncharacterised protein [Segatella copri]
MPVAARTTKRAVIYLFTIIVVYLLLYGKRYCANRFLTYILIILMSIYSF